MSLEQARALAAHVDIEQLHRDADEATQKRYATVVYQAIALVRNAGLVQTLEFLAALTTGPKRDAAERFLGHLAGQLRRVDGGIMSVETLRTQARKANLRSYMWLTRETMATLVWYRRFVQSVLKIDPTELEKE